MKKYFVIGNPIEHSLSPKLHNHWIKENNINAIYDKIKLNENEIQNIIDDLKNEKISGINVTVPFKKSVIPFIDELTPIAKKVESVNTIFKKNNKIVGDNTDVGGFEAALKHINYNVKNKIAFLLGAGGVAPAIIIALKRMGIEKIILSNRTKQKAEILKKIYSEIEVIDWGEMADFDLIINATSLGLKHSDEINLNYNKCGPNKLFFDVIYNPKKTNFLSNAKLAGNRIENGKMMFIFQAQLSFKIWHKILPTVTKDLLN